MSILRMIALSIVCAAGAFGQSQGSFAQIAYGGSWQTTFTLLNLSTTDLASITLSFFNDDGSPLSAPVQGFGNAATYTFTIPEGGATNVVLASSNSTVTQGWATMTFTSGIVRGQGSFRFLLPGGQISEAVVPLSMVSSGVCILSFPVVPGAAPVIVIPFDNTTDPTTGNTVYVTSLAIANLTNGPLAVPIEFDDQLNHKLVTDTLSLGAMQHMAFLTPKNYPALAGMKGTLRINESTSMVTVLGLLSNVTNAITTILPVTQ